MNFELKEVKEYVNKSFKIDPDTTITSNVLLLRVPGFNSESLAKYILEKFNFISCDQKFIETYKFSDKNWIKIEKNYKGYRLSL